MFNPYIIRPANPAQAGAPIPQPSDNQPRLRLDAPDGKDAVALQDTASSGAERMNRKRLHGEMALHAECEPRQPHPVKRRKRALIGASSSASEDAADSRIGRDNPLIGSSPAEPINQRVCARKIQHAFRQYRVRNADELRLKAYLHAVMEKVNNAIGYSPSAIIKNREPSDLVPFDYRIQLTDNGARLVHASTTEKNEAQFCSLDVFYFGEYANKQVARNSENSWILEKRAFLARHGYGNCVDLAVYAQSIILRDLASRHPITFEPGSDALKKTVICRLPEGDHAFAVLGNLADDHALVVDPWAKYINTTVRGKHTDLAVRHTEKTRGFLGRMAQFKDFLLSKPELFGLQRDSGNKEPSIVITVPNDAEKIKPAQYAAIADAIEARVRDGNKTLVHQKDKQLFKKYVYRTVYRAS